MRHQDLRRPRGIESLWLQLRLLAARTPLPYRTPAVTDLASLSEHQLRDVGLERRDDPGETVTFWRLKR